MTSLESKNQIFCTPLFNNKRRLVMRKMHETIARGTMNITHIIFLSCSFIIIIMFYVPHLEIATEVNGGECYRLGLTKAFRCAGRRWNPRKSTGRRRFFDFIGFLYALSYTRHDENLNIFIQTH